MDDNRKPGWKTFTEEIEVTGQQLLETINRLIAEGNVRKLNIKSESGDVFLSVPLTGGAVAGGILDARRAVAGADRGCGGVAGEGEARGGADGAAEG